MSIPHDINDELRVTLVNLDQDSLKVSAVLLLLEDIDLITTTDREKEVTKTFLTNKRSQWKQKAVQTAIDECLRKLDGSLASQEELDYDSKGGTVQGNESVPEESPTPINDAAAAVYQTVISEIDTESYAFRGRIAAQLQPHFNAYVKTLPQSSYEEKQELAKWINAELRSRGLALKCPKHGVPSYLLVDMGRHPEEGRFQFCHWEDGTLVRVSRNTLPDLELIAQDLTDPTPEQGPGWVATTQRATKKSPRSKS